MKQIVKKLVCIILALLVIAPILPSDRVYANNLTQLNIVETIINKGSTTALSVLNAEGSVITWTSENIDVATVDKDGIVTGVDKGKTNIIANVVCLGSTNANRYVCEVGVKTADYLPKTPANFRYLAGKDMIAGTYVVFSDKTSSLGAFWEINNVKGNKIIENEFTSEASVITVAQSQSLVIHRGYAVPISDVSNSILKLYNLNEAIILY
ncbi:MAG: Ig-like domain-containing protein [Lachnotalea sp.]